MLLTLLSSVVQHCLQRKLQLYVFLLLVQSASIDHMIESM